MRNVTRAGAPITSKGELPFDSDGELRRERIIRSHGNREALPLDRVWKAEQIGGGKGISSKPLARQALRASVGWVSRTNWGSRTRTLALIGVSRYDSGRL